MRPPPYLPARALALAVAFALAAAPRAAATAQTPAKPEGPKPVEIHARPAPAPVPALSVRLLPGRYELVPGNAAGFYQRAIQMLLESRLRWQAEAKPPEPGKPAPESPEAAVSRWASAAARDIPRDEARKALARFEQPLLEVDLGARRVSCDWQLDDRTEGFMLLIPEIQEMRQLVRLVVLRARLAALDGKTDEALHWLQNGFVMGRHVGNGSLLIQALVGVAVSHVTARAAEDLIESPGGPNLYWALTVLPRPFVDVNLSLEGERHVIDRYLPSLSELESSTWSTDRVRRAIDDLIRDLAPLVDHPVEPGKEGRPSLNGAGKRLLVAGMIARGYPEARRALIASGRPAAEVDAMPASQVVLIHSLRTYHAQRDEMFKWTRVPYWLAARHLSKGGYPPAPEKSDNPVVAVIGMLEPAFFAARLAEVRLDRQLDMLRAVEAVRLHAAAHGGKLPATLSEIDEVPVPDDPATGRPFDYRVKGSTATLSGPVPPGGPNHPSYAILYELTLETPR